MRFRTDSTWQRFGTTVLAGSPLSLFRTTRAGADVLDRIEAGDHVDRDSSLVVRLSEAGALHPCPTSGPFEPADVTVVTPQLGGVVRDDGRVTVDDGSVPPLAGATLRLPVNRGPAAARNAARSVIRTPLVAFVDADVDTRVDGSWLTRLIAHFDDPSVGLVAPRVLGEPGSPLDLGPEPARIRAGTRVGYVPGAALVVRVEALDSVGWFDERLRYGEDVDLVWRLDDRGWRCRYVPAAEVWHRPRPDVARRLTQHHRYGTSAAPLALRHPHALAPWRSNGWTAAVWTLAMAGLPGPAALVAAGSAGALVPRLPDLPPRATLTLALRGHLAGGRQLAEATRRAWWPLVAVGALVSKRLRWIGLAALLVAPRAAPTDLAYGCGVWSGVVRHRTAAPIVPSISAWPGRTRRPGPAAPDRRVPLPSDR